MTTTNLNARTTDPRSPLRGVLATNSVTSAAAGLAAAIAPATVGEVLGIVHDRGDLIVRVVGLGLILFAVEVAVTAVRHREATIARDSLLISAADLAWVISTIVVLATVDLSTTGRVIAAVMGVGVATFAALQLRLGRSSIDRTHDRPENRR